MDTPTRPPSIQDAKELAYKLRQSGVLVLTIGGGEFGASSYGMTRKKCAAMKKVLDQVADLIRGGLIEIPEELH
jgi:hypothetical protein